MLEARPRRLASSKGPPLPKPTHPATTSPDGPAPRDPLRWTPSQTLLGPVRRFLLPKAGAPSPTFLLKDLDTSLPLGPSCPIMSTLPPTGSSTRSAAISGEGPSPERPQVRGPEVTPATITHTQCHCRILRPRVIWAMDKSYTETQFPCEGHGGNDSPNHSVRLGCK